MSDSHILVNISEDLLGRTIECANKSGQIIGSNLSKLTHHQVKLIFIHTCTLSNYNILHNNNIIIIKVFPSPNITLSEINTDQLTFTWDSISTNVSGVQYFVSTSNCGVCPNTTLIL